METNTYKKQAASPIDSLIRKYDVAAPRYTSYPTVPYWDPNSWSPAQWISTLQKREANAPQGISLYIHLPYCESLCTYCGCNTRITKNHRVEIPYIEAICREWGLYKSILGPNIVINDIHLGGGTPTFFSAEHLRLLISTLRNGMVCAEQAEFSFEAHPANTTSEHLSALYEVGFRRLSLGIQDFDPQVQHIINRKQSPSDVIRVMQAARKIGYHSINFDLIYGLPLQTLRGIQDTLHIALSMKPDRIAFYSYAHVPWIKPGQRLFTEAHLPDSEEKLLLYQTGRALISQAGYMDIGMDHFALPHDNLALAAQEGSLHRNFMGYTDRKSPLLIGLGVSSISDSWTAFSQNVKQVEEYLHLVNAGQLPLLKGHILTQEDLRIREQILQIMCQGRLSLRQFPLSGAVLKRLSPLEEEGFIRISNTLLEVSPLGKSFLRNICMMFDEKLVGKEEKSPLFSKAI